MPSIVKNVYSGIKRETGMKHHVSVIMLAACVLLAMAALAGCDKSQSTDAATKPAGQEDATTTGAVRPSWDDQSTPAAALNKFVNALRAGDGERVVQVVIGAEEQKPFFIAMAQSTKAVLDFDKVAGAKFGNSWLEAQAATEDFSIASMSNTLDQYETSVRIETSGDRAVATPSQQPGQPLNLVKKDGKWFIQPDDAMPSDAQEIAEGVRMYDALRDSFTRAQARIEEPGMTPEKLNAELAREILAIEASGDATEAEAIQHTVELRAPANINVPEAFLEPEDSSTTNTSTEE